MNFDQNENRNLHEYQQNSAQNQYQGYHPRCRYCGSEVDDEDSFCQNCGKPLKREALQEQKKESNGKSHAKSKIVIIALSAALAVCIFVIVFVPDRTPQREVFPSSEVYDSEIEAVKRPEPNAEETSVYLSDSAAEIETVQGWEAGNEQDITVQEWETGNAQDIIVQERETDNELDIAEKQTEYFDRDRIVTDAYHTEIPFSRHYRYNEKTGESEYVDVVYTYSIPEINLDSDDVRRVNGEIYDFLYDSIQKAVDSITNKEFNGGVILDASYSWTLKNDVLSLIVQKGPWGASDNLVLYIAYNISLSEESKIPDKKLYRMAGFSDEEYLARARQVLGSAFWSKFSRDDDYIYDNVKMFNKALEDTISDENIAASKLCFNEKGHLCILALIYSGVGFTDYYYVLDMEEFELVEDYDVPISAKDIQ